MKSWNAGQKLLVIIPTAIVAMVGLYGYSTWEGLPRRALVPGQTQTLDHTVGAILRTRSTPYKYLIFSPGDMTKALEGADLRFLGTTQVSGSQLGADSGRVNWRNGRYGSHTVPGLFIHVQASISPGESVGPREDTLMLRLPGLQQLADRFGDDVLISYNGNTPRPGDSVMMQRYTAYPDLAAVERARTPYLVLALVMGLLVLVILARALIWTIG